MTAVLGVLQTTIGKGTGIQPESQGVMAENHETQCRNLLWNRERSLCEATDTNEDATMKKGESEETDKREPKDGNLRIISANIHSLRPRAEIVVAW